MVEKKRLDILLVERGLEESRSRSAARIMAGDVVVNEQRVDKPGSQIRVDAHIRLKGKKSPYVSRGGLKIQGAFEKWPISAQDRICLDVGASTGGFTDFLLQQGAQKVFAVDVGYGQLHWKLQTDGRVINMERSHILKMDVDAFDDRPSLCVMDVSFISVEKILPHLKTLLEPGSELVVLVKPQFELRPGDVGKGGIVRDPEKREQALQRIHNAALEMGYAIEGSLESPIQGADGNVEYLLYMRFPGEMSS